jgi:hypothetical protein
MTTVDDCDLHTLLQQEPRGRQAGNSGSDHDRGTRRDSIGHVKVLLI